MVVDFHNHFYPPEYLAALRTGPISVRVTMDPAGNPVIHYPGDYNVVVPDHRDIEVRTQSLDRAGIDRQVLTFTTPGTYLEEPDRAAALSRVINDAFAEICRERGDRFVALATLPLNDPQASRVELERAMKKLDLPGAMLFSNVSGVPLADVARTSVLLLGAAACESSIGWLLKGRIHSFHPVYLKHYFRLRASDDRQQLSTWQSIVAAARLSENISEQQDWLLAKVKAGFDN